MRDKIILLIVNLNSIILFLCLTTSTNFYVEFIASFLPYFVIIDLLINVFLIILILKKKYFFFKNINGVYEIYLLSLITLIINIFLLATALIRIFDFYFINNISQSQGNQNNELKIVFFNKKFNNNNYSNISRIIRDLDPDLIGIAESEIDLQTKIDYLSNYKYILRSEGDIYFPVMLFSKVEIDNYVTTKNFDLIEASFGMKKDPISLIVLHTISPVNQSALEMRNRQIMNLCNITNKYKGSNLVVMGDFNLSNWSQKTEDFIKCSNLFNAAKGKGINYTWSGVIFENFPKIHTIIDHVYYSKNVVVEDFDILDKYQSDHNLIYFKVKY